MMYYVYRILGLKQKKMNKKSIEMNVNYNYTLLCIIVIINVNNSFVFPENFNWNPK